MIFRMFWNLVIYRGSIIQALLCSQLKEKIKSAAKVLDSNILQLKIQFTSSLVGERNSKKIIPPSVIKSLTNNTEVIYILSRLGHCVSYSILCISLKMYTENAYLIQKQQSDEDILPINTIKETFMIYIAYNIDRNEETLTGQLNFVKL